MVITQSSSNSIIAFMLSGECSGSVSSFSSIIVVLISASSIGMLVSRLIMSKFTYIFVLSILVSLILEMKCS